MSFTISSWTLVDPLRWVRTDPDGYYQSYGYCSPQGNSWRIFLSLIVVVNALALFLANVQAWKARNISTEFSESSYVALTMASFLQALLIGLPLLALVQSDSKARYFVWSGIIFVVSSTVLLLMFGPKILAVKNGMESSVTSLRGSATDNLPSILRKASNYENSQRMEDRIRQKYKERFERLKDLLQEKGINTDPLFEKAELSSFLEDEPKMGRSSENGVEMPHSSSRSKVSFASDIEETMEEGT